MAPRMTASATSSIAVGSALTMIRRAPALLATGTTAKVRAGDLYYPPPPPQRGYIVNQSLIDCSWAGPYLGGNLSYDWGKIGNHKCEVKQLDEMNDKFEDIEHEQFGEDGFEDAVKQISAIESSLGLADISQFTAPPPPKV